MKLQLKRSNVLEIGAAKEPTAAQMEYGELAVNYNNGDPAIFIKDSADNIIRIAGKGNISSGDTPSGETPPNTGNTPGDVFFNTLNNTLYYWDGSTWVPIASEENAADIFVGTISEIDSEIPKAERKNGYLWWNTEDGTLYVWYKDGNTDQWVVAVPGAGSGGGEGGASVTISDTAPSTPNSNPGDLWWDSEDGRLYIYYEDENSAQWVDASPSISNGIDDAPADGNQYARKNNNWTVVTSSGSGGDTTINYSGAAAWGDVAADGTLKGGLNVTDANVTKTALGKYSVVFTTPMPNDSYSVVLSANVGSTATLSVDSKTSTGFTLMNARDTGGGVTSDIDFSFTVHATNALPPKGSTGTDAWGAIEGDGTVDASYNIASVTRTSAGRYDVVFTTAMPTPNYAINATVTPSDDTLGWIVGGYNKTIQGFELVVYNSSGVTDDIASSFTVNATNANLPNTVTQEQIESAINNPGASAWGYISGASGGLTGGLNISSVTRTGTGQYDVVFATPMPSAVYSVVTGVSPNSNKNVQVWNQTATGFTTRVDAPTDSSDINFVVFATNALPPKGGTGTDAWASVQSDGTIDASFNVESVTKTATGTYDVVFTSPMPSSSYAVALNIMEDANPTSTKFTAYYNLTTTGFSIKTKGSANLVDLNFSFSVNCTNATLPTTFTEEEIQAVVDLAKGNGGTLVSAGATFNGPTLTASYNIESCTLISTGTWAVVFKNPMPNNNYSVVGSSATCIVSSAAYTSQTVNGFTLACAGTNGTAYTPTANYPFSFQVVCFPD